MTNNSPSRAEEPPALAAERLERLLALVRAARVVRVDEAVAKLGVSPATVRRDLEALEKRGALRRVHGGAVSVETRTQEPLFDDKTSLAAREKRAIAAAALACIRPDDTIYLDGGSTVLELARLVRERGDLTVVTNSLRAAMELAGQGPRLILIGGELRRRSQTVVGVLSRFVLEQVRVDKAFMGTMGLTLEGLTTTDPNEAYTKLLVAGRAQEVILLMDSSKAGQVSFARSGALSDVDVLITDRGLEPRLAARLRKAGVRVECV